MPTRASLIVSALALACLAATSRAGTEAQDLTFGVNGFALAGAPAVNETWNAHALQPDGRIVVAGTKAQGTPNAAFIVRRYLITGATDPSFNGGATLQINFPAGNARAIAIQPDGKILVGGDSAELGAPNVPTDVAIARLNVNGALDPTFGTGGTLITDLAGGQTDSLAQLLLVPGGRIWALGSASSSSSPSATSWSIIAYDANGSIDQSFGASGRVLIDMGEAVNFASALDAIIQNGKVIVVGTSGSRFVAARLDPATGALDPTFGAAGRTFVSFPTAALTARATSVAAQADGKLVLVGDGNVFDSDAGEPGPPLSHATRLSANGQVDPSFSAFQNAGIFSPNPVARVVGSKILVKVGGAQFIRLNDNGSRDQTFGSGGIFTPPAVQSGLFSTLAIQPDGLAVTAGQIFSNLQSDAAVIRVNVGALPPAPCVGDADGNRTVTFADITTILSNFGATGQPFRPGDSDGSSVVNFADIVSSLSNFGAVCP